MNHSFSYAFALHRVFDSAAPEWEAVFFCGGRRLLPYRKPGGIYVFIDEPVPQEPLLIRCPGYQDQLQRPKPRCLSPVRLYPARHYFPPPGWQTAAREGQPGQNLFLPDASYRVRLLGRPEPLLVELACRPGFLGGCLGWSGGFALISKRLGAGRFYLDCEPPAAVASFQRGYAARADGQGEATLVVPEGFAVPARALSQTSVKEDALSEWER